ncbi:MAG: hypothetical protein JWM25_525 [Thermoleophilia bacterium]|nr:hypothetical protein [Thermoleophilia bacterium]
MLTLACVCAWAATVLAVPSTAAAAAELRTLFLTETIRPGAVRAPIRGPIQPHELVAQPGEEEGFILAVRPSAASQLSAVVSSDSSALMRQWSQVLRVQNVQIRRPSTKTGAAPGAYPDPLPPQAPGVAGGLLNAPAGSWSGFVVVVSVPAAQPAGRYPGTIVVQDARGTVVARQPFAVTVATTRSRTGAVDPAIAPHDARNFKVLFNFNPAWYRTLAPAKTLQDQYEQTYRTLWMLARHRAAPTHWQRAYPAGDGTYSCTAADGFLKVFDDMPWWADGRPGAVPVALMPNHAIERCNQAAFTIRDDRGKASKFDDTVGDPTKSAWFIYRVADQWRRSGLQDHRTYFLNPFDEPSAAQSRTSVPQVNSLVHDYAPGVKVLGTTWPKADNVQLRDGGSNDLDGWVAPYFRAWGFGVSAAQAKRGINRSREVQQRLAKIQQAGGEAWTYDLPVGTNKVPQISIDSPASDARFMFWPLARDGYNGWFIAVSNRWVNPANYAQARNPWDDPLSWIGSKSADLNNAGPHGVISNGWGSLFYPGYRPALGLTDPLAQPVSSLRLERMRDGVEDANLMRQYRDRFGQAALNRKLTTVIGPLRAVAGMPSNETFYGYRNAGLPLRMELLRRQMLAELSR